MSDPNGTREVSATIKVPESKRYAGDAPWLVYRAPNNEALVEALSGAEDVLQRVQEVQGFANTLSRNPDVGLGAKTVSKGSDKAAEKPQEAAEASASKPAEEKVEDPILFALKAATTLDEVKTVRAENQAAFNDNPEYLAAWKARGKAIKNGEN